MKDNKYAWGPGRLHEPGFLMSEFLETNPMIGPCEPFGGKTDKTSAHDIVKNCVARKFEYLLHFQRNIVIAAYWFREDYIYIGRIETLVLLQQMPPMPGIVEVQNTPTSSCKIPHFATPNWGTRIQWHIDRLSRWRYVWEVVLEKALRRFWLESWQRNSSHAPCNLSWFLLAIVRISLYKLSWQTCLHKAYSTAIDRNWRKTRAEPHIQAKHARAHCMRKVLALCNQMVIDALRSQNLGKHPGRNFWSTNNN